MHEAPKDTFHVTCFEASNRIGGLWPIDKIDDEGLVNPDMCVNQSRHTVSFSDLAWEEGKASFLKAWEVGKYLERYVDKYGVDIKLESRVMQTEMKGARWEVRVRERAEEKVCVLSCVLGFLIYKSSQAFKNLRLQPQDLTQVQTYDFDHLIVATGFFGKPKIPKIFNESNVPVWHSSKIRDVKDLLTEGCTRPPAPGRNIVVVGGQMSGVETAGSLAFQISSAVKNPGESPFPEPEKYVVCNVVQKPVWVMPLFFPRDPDVEVTEGGVTTKVLLVS
jgi:cation diffusion facilitator CzcD-associated flavoprotein CzcO